MEIQVNVVAIAADNIDFTKSLFEKEVSVDSIILFKDENVDVIGVVKGNGYEGVTTR